ncbi:MAG TPA: electron transfer flavoprotein subunit alpha [Spirochaetes bacterium]|nr:electron transfer flavoprotein subunit alpha [Spirochaetota bacterium]
MNIKVEEAVCTKCGICRKYCSFDAIEYEDGLPVFNINCVLCGACVKPCPADAINIDRKVLKRDLSGYSGVMAYIEIENDEVKQIGLEMVSAAKRLADKLGEICSAVVLGADGEKVREILSDYGAQKICAVENEALKIYNTEIYTNIMAGIISKYRPSIVLFGATHLGRDLAPRVAGRIDTGLTADCTGLEINEEGNLLQIRPTFGGNIMATIITPNHRPQMATVRPNVMKRAKQGRKDPMAAEIETIAVDIDLKKQNIKLIDEVREVSPFSNVGEADFIVSGGKGLGKAENFNLLKDLVQDLAGMVGESRVALGASRAAVDAGWIPHQHQVGQTGKAVTPKLYIACGISGQIQHVMGMRESEKIIAVNTDRNAPIFRMADLGIVGDLKEVIPKLKNYLRENIGKLEK